MIISPGEEGAGLYAYHGFVCLFCERYFLSFFFSSWCQGLAAASDCGTLWTFLLTFLFDLIELDVNIKSALRLDNSDSVRNSNPDTELTIVN